MKNTFIAVLGFLFSVSLWATEGSNVSCRLVYDLLNSENQIVQSFSDKAVAANVEKEGQRRFHEFFFKAKLEESKPNAITPGYLLTLELTRGLSTASRTVQLKSGQEPELEDLSLTVGRDRLTALCQSEGVPQP